MTIRATVGLVALALSACTASRASVFSAEPTASPAQYVAAGESARQPSATEHLIVISIDGLRPDAIERFDAPTLQRLIREGSYSANATTIFPSITLPSHTSMITGAEPAVHGITWNDNHVAEKGLVKIPTIFSVAREHGLHTAGFFSKGKFHHLVLPNSLDRAVLPEGNGKWLAGTTAEKVEQYLSTERPNLLFVHFGDPDYAGHLVGWMGRVYGWAVRRADGAVARVLAAADQAYGAGQYTVIVTADHGGHGRTHGTSAATDMTIPWIAWGRGVLKATELPRSIHTTDTAATALWLLGIAPTAEMAGVPVLTAFTSTHTRLLAEAQPARSLSPEEVVH